MVANSRFGRLVVGALFGCLPLFASLPAQAAGEAGHGPHHDLARGRSAASASATASSLQLQSGGGPVLTSPSVYLSFWGSPNSSARTYLESFFSAVGGSGWQNVATQYCSNAPVGATSCAAGSTFAGNPTAEWKGSWVDTTAVPSSPVDADIDSAAQRAIAHFGYHAGAVYFVMTPSGHSESGFGTSWCAWHASTVSGSSRVPYTYLPYEPDAGSACGVNAVNPTDSFGHGIFDGFSIVGGHEFMEAITDPFPNNSWIDANGNENADKCQWSAGPVANYTFGSTFFAVQPTWSNASASCALSLGVVTPPPPPPPPPAPPPTTGGPGRGYAILNSAGAIYTFGSARYYGNLLDHGYPGVAVSLAVTPDGAGYNILTTAGAIYSFGDATYFGNLLDHGYPGPAVSLSETPSNRGYALLTGWGGIYTFGDAPYYGNLVDHGYPGTAVALAYTSSGHGYYILTRSGAIYSFGDAVYRGNLLDHGYPGVAIGLAVTKDGLGYSILTTSGAIYSFGDALYYGNLLDHGYPGPAVAIGDTP